MSGFSAEWLALREPYDGAARNATVLDAVAAAFSARADDRGGRSRLRHRLDVARASRRACRGARAGAWSTTTSGLLAQARALGQPPRITVTAVPVDLARDLEVALDGPARSRHHSALLDLVSPEWLDRLVVEAAARQLPVYAALSYDGRVRDRAADRSMTRCSRPSTGTSAPTRASVRRSGRRPRHAAERFRAGRLRGPAGPLRLGVGPDDRAIQEALLAGWAEAARLTADLPPDQIAVWLARRRAHLAAGRSRCGSVTSMFARPIGRR